jgi:hypothetical protein
VKLFIHRKHEGPSMPELGSVSEVESASATPEPGVVACTIYVPAASRNRAFGGVVVDVSSEGVVIVSSGSIGRYDQEVEVEFGLSPEQDLVRCRVLSREPLNPRLNAFELALLLDDDEREALVRRLVVSTSPDTPASEQRRRHVA